MEKLIKKVAVLFAREDSIYKDYPECDVYDINRDARNYNGNLPVIAHPPCRSWGKLKGLANPAPGERELAYFSVDQVRKNGGVLEHPAYSSLWKAANLPVKGFDNYGGWTFFINQSWFGHKAEKKTWLYIVGCHPRNIPDYNIVFDAVTYVISSSAKTSPNYKRQVTKKERESTPETLAQYLIELAKLTKNGLSK